LTYTDNGLGVRTWVIPILNAGESITFDYRVTVGDTTPEGSYENIVVLFHSGSPIDQASYIIEVRLGLVLGEELPDTGSPFLGWYYLLAGLTVVGTGAGYVMANRRQHLTQGINFLQR